MWERGWRWTPSWRVGPGEILLPRSHPRNCLTVMRRVLPIPRASRDWVRESSWSWRKEWRRSDGASGVWRIGCAGAYWRSVSYTHLRAHETDSYLVCRLLLEK